VAIAKELGEADEKRFAWTIAAKRLQRAQACPRIGKTSGPRARAMKNITHRLSPEHDHGAPRIWSGWPIVPGPSPPVTATCATQRVLDETTSNESGTKTASSSSCR